MIYAKTCLLRYTLLIAALVAGAPAQAAPITFNTALPVSDGEFIARQQIIFSRASDDLNGVSRDVQTWRSVSVLGYGVNRKLAIFGVVPVVSRETQIGPVSNRVSGLGDATLFARYQIYQYDAPGRTLRLSPFAGVTIPTGRSGRTGDGAVDTFAGLIFTAASTGWNFDSQVSHRLNANANGFARGDVTNLDASLQYRIFPSQVTAQTPGFLYAVIEANASQAAMSRRAGVVDTNTGGDLITLSPGVQYATRRWIAEMAVRVPVAKNLNGTALEPDYSIITSLRVNF